MAIYKHPLYQTWAAMRQRCHNPNNDYYPRYGGRGIFVCERWHNFENFAADMGEKPTLKHTLERIDNDGPYSPENCCWATMKENRNNTRANKYLTLDGETKTISQWSDHYNIDQIAVNTRLRNGWEPIKALTTPVKPRR